MGTTLHNTFILIFFIFITTTLSAQVDAKSDIRYVPENTEVSIVKGFNIPAGKTAILLDSGKGKLCSCQFYTPSAEIDRKYEANKQLTLKKITVKGLFNGTELHIARVYFNETSDYYKFKCYSKDISVLDVGAFLSFGTSAAAVNKEE